MAHYRFLSRIQWQPTVLSFSFSSKELKAKDPLANIRSRLEDLDIKTIVPYVVDHTTHVVQSKRNTAKGLQALVNGKWIVDQSYVDALVYAATPGDLENLESLSPLEADFDTAWPDPSLHLPPPGKEPMQRPPEAFAPNPDRINIFEGYTFIFGDVSQYENLADPINNAHGKALLYKVEPGATTAEEIVQFMRNAAGNKGLGEEREGPGGVVLVRFRSQGKYEDWSIALSNQVAVMTDQRVIQQSEFLDAILANDASSLCRSLPPGPDSAPDSGPIAVPESQLAPAPPENDKPPSVSRVFENVSQVPNSQPSARSKAPRVRSFVSKMKNFDDGFDLASIPAYVPEEEGAESSLPSAKDLEPLSEPPSHQPSQLPSQKPSQKSQQPSQRQNQLEDNEEEAQEQEEVDVMAGLLPGANAMKRRRAETGPSRRASPAAQPKEEVEPKPKRKKLDVLEAARKHREAEEDAWRRQEEVERSRQDDLNDTPIEKLKGLAIVEEWDVPLRKPLQAREERWDERWNGRKNFKKFRRKGEPRYASNRVQRVIVPLEEMTRKDFGIGDHYWVSSRESREEDSPADSRIRERQSSRNEESNHADDGDFGQQEDGLGGSAAQSQSASVSRVESEASMSRSQSRSQNRSQKRPREVRDSDSEDELRFRFRRRR